MSLEKPSLIITIQYFYSIVKKNPVEQRKLFEKPVQDCVSFSERTLRQWISQTKSIFKDNKNRKIDNRKITEYFNTDKSNSKKLIQEKNSNDIRRESNSKIRKFKTKKKVEKEN